MLQLLRNGMCIVAQRNILVIFGVVAIVTANDISAYSRRIGWLRNSGIGVMTALDTRQSDALNDVVCGVVAAMPAY